MGHVNGNELLWVERYRPSKIEDCILPARIKGFFQSQIDKGDAQNLLLVGGPGTGKTTSARALCEQLGYDYIVINATEKGDIGTLRGVVRPFASSVSFTDSMKCVILDEADYFDWKTQPALRAFIEEFSHNCRFILTANLSNKIIDPIKSRCVVVDFQFSKEEKKSLIVDFDRRVKGILEQEGIEYDKKSMAQVIIKYFPDFRRTLNELQRHCHSGSLSGSAVVLLGDDSISALVKHLKEKDFSTMRKWVHENSDNDFAVIQRGLYDRMYEVLLPDSIPPLVMLLAQYDYRNAFCMDKEINLLAMLTEVMVQCEFK